MSYQPPFNGGRLNATISGNTAGAGSLVSSGTLTLAGGNNITLSQAGNAVTISGASQSNQTVGFSAGNNTSLTSSGSFDARSYRLNGMGAASVGFSASSVFVSVPVQSQQTSGLFNLQISGNTSGATASVSSGTLTLHGGNNITLSQAGNAVTISGGAGGGGGGGVALSAGGSLYSSGTAALNAGGALTIASTTGQSLIFSVPAQSNLSATGIVSISNNGNTISIGAPGFSAGIFTNNTVSNRIIFAAGSNISLSQNTNASGGTISFYAPDAGAGGGGVAISGGGTSYTSGTVKFSAASGAISISSGTGQALNFGVPATSSLQGTGGLNIVTNGNTISMGVQPAATFSRWEYPEGIFTPLALNGNGSLSINHVYMPFNVVGTAMKIGGSLAAATNTSATTASANITLWMGIYTLNVSTLSLASSGSATQNFAWSQSASTTGNTSVNSMRQMTVPMNVNMTPGQYWAAAVISSATTYTSVAYTIFGNSLVNGVASGAVLSPIGSNTSVNRDVMLFQGIYTSNVSAGPAVIVGSDINNTAASNVMRANFYHVIYNTTY